MANNAYDNQIREQIQRQLADKAGANAAQDKRWANEKKAKQARKAARKQGKR